MKVFTDNLRKRVDELGISLAEAARRCGLSERRLANYAAGSREPDLATLLKIAETLDTTPNDLLGVGTTPDTGDERTVLRVQLAADVRPLDAGTLRLVVGLVRTIVEHRRGVGVGATGKGRKTR